MGSGGFTIAQPLDVFVEPAEAAEVTAELVRIFRDHGPREARSKCRLAHLIEDWGIAGAALRAVRTPDARTDRAGEDMRQAGVTRIIWECSRKSRRVSAQSGLAVVTGRTSADQVAELARLSDVYGAGRVRLTTGQNAIIPDVAVAECCGAAR